MHLTFHTHPTEEATAHCNPPRPPRVRSGRGELRTEAFRMAPQAIRRGLNVNDARAAPSGAAGITGHYEYDELTFVVWVPR
jgi:hypothetical protein